MCILYNPDIIYSMLSKKDKHIFCRKGQVRQ